MNFAEQLKSQLNIVDVVGQYVRLKRQGAGPRYVGLCPFHSERTPSFGVHSVLQYYKCFGCDAAGDVFKFVQTLENLTFPETLRTLAERYGIPMPQREKWDDPEAQKRTALLEMHEAAAKVFQDNLRGPNGADARAYLASRGVQAGSADEFRLGYAEHSGEQLLSRLQKFGASLLEESGLFAKRHDGSFFDRFRRRLIFPIHDESGRVIAFGGRALDSDDQPKYLNSPETKIYKKSSVLYNLHRAKISARKNDRMILVEGYMDVIGVYAAGIHEVVASSGTSLGIDQIRSIKRQVSQQNANSGQILLNFDPDTAGERSTEKYISALLAEGLRVKVVQIPGGLDPDEYIQHSGPEAYRVQLEGAVSYFHWLADRARGKFDMHTAEGRVDAFRSISPAIQQVSDQWERATIMNEIAEYLKVDQSRLPKTSTLGERRVGSRVGRGTHAASMPPNEKLLLGCMLVSNGARSAVRHYFANSMLLDALQYRGLFEAVITTDEEPGFSLERLTPRLEARFQQVVTELGFADLGIKEDDATEQALRCLRALEQTAARGRMESLRARIKEAERTGDVAQALRLMRELDGVEPQSAGL
jgi:DNA primase